MSILIFLLTLSSIAKACDKTIVIYADMKDCTMTSSSEIACNVPRRTDLTIPSEGKSCIIIRSPINNAILSRISIKLHMFLECQSQVRFYTKAMNFQTATSRQCYGTGSCVGRTCSIVQPSHTIPELDHVNGYDGYTYCMEGDASGCDFNVPACMFYRIYGEPIHNESMPVFQCTSWEPRVFADIEIMGARNSTFYTANVTTVYNTYQTDLLTFALVDIPENKTALPDRDLLFVRNGSTVAWLNGAAARQEASMVMCRPDCSFSRFDPFYKQTCGKCYLSTNFCKCEYDNLKVSCNCDNQTELLHSLKTEYLPNKINNAITTLGSSGKPQVYFRAHAHVMVNSIRASSQILLTKCAITKALLYGCSNCLEGASLYFVCEASVETLGHVRCSQQEFAVQCGKSVMQRITYMANTAYVNEKCIIECPLSEKQFTLEATLPFVDHSDLQGWENLHGKDKPTPGFWETAKYYLRGLLDVGIVIVILVACVVIRIAWHRRTIRGRLL
uniref:Phlebovirus_G2 domain-containing protein n=1 Tax=Panagrellus redivivus TaxID=6233 RepID=A0A7E4ZX80_PANRE